MREKRTMLGTILFRVLWLYGQIRWRGIYIPPNRFLGIQICNLPQAVINERHKISAREGYFDDK